ncbi:hypothetical protein ACXWOU_09530, partial [Streptococcus pyogenes]
IQNEIIGQGTTTNNLTTLAGVSTTTQGIASRMTANVLASGKRIGNLALAFLSWPFAWLGGGLVQSCTSSIFNWFTLLLVLIIISIL